MEYFAETNHKLSDNSTKLTVTGSSYFENAFGNVLIRSTSKECHCWQFKILKNKESYGIDIGIVKDENNHLDLQQSFTSNGYGYGLCSNGNIYSSSCSKKNYKLKNCKQKYKTNDIVLMTLDLNNGTLSFVIHSEKSQKSINAKITIHKIKMNEKIHYKMAVYLSQKKDSIKLLNHIKTAPIDEKQEQELESMTAINSKYEEMIHKLQAQLLLTKQENDKYKINVNALQNELVDMNSKKTIANQLNLEKICKENEEIMCKLQDEIKGKDLKLMDAENRIKTLEIKLDEREKENEIKLNNVYQQIDTFKNHNFRLSQQNEEHKQSNKRQQTRILTLQRDNQLLRNNRDQTQIINLNQRKQIASLQNENYQLKKSKTKK